MAQLLRQSARGLFHLRSMNTERTWMRWLERALFLIGVLLVVHPVVSSRFFFTVDGPAHAYNASLLLDLFDTPSEGRAWEVNPVPVPNWTGHVLLALLQLVLQAPEALKVVYLLCLVGLPFAFRAVVKDHSSGPPWASSLSLPLAMHLPFAMGYLNFAIGIVLFLLIVHRWERLVRTSFAQRQWWYLAILLLVLYFSHLVPFLFALIWLGLQWCYAALGPGAMNGPARGYWLRKAGLLVFCALPGSLFTAAYLLSGSSDGASLLAEWGAGPDRWYILFLPFQNADGPSEVLIWKMFLFAVGAIILGLSMDIGPLPRQHASGPPASLLVPVGAFMIATILFATLPDRFGKGGDVLIRMTLLMHLCAFIVIAHLPIPRTVGLSAALLGCGMVVLQDHVRSGLHKAGEERTRQCYEACSKIPVGSTIVTVAFPWTDAHLAEIAAADRHALHLSNYEFINPHFPLRWKPLVAEQMRMLPNDPLDRLGAYSNTRGALIRIADHIIVMGGTPVELGPGAMFDMERELERSHVPTFANNTCRIYSRR